MTLTFKLDLDMNQVDLHVKFLVYTSNGSAVRELNYRNTDGTDSITPITDAGGKKQTHV